MPQRRSTMKINELSRLTHIHPETIRMYRQKGFLHPEKLPNGYYEYSTEDYVSLIYLRKLREYDLSLEEADAFEHSVSRNRMVRLLDEKEASLSRMIDDMKMRRHFLRLEKRHIRESFDMPSSQVSVMQSIDEKIDCYDMDFLRSVPGAETTSFYLTSTPTLRIPKEILNGPVSNQVIPIQTGIGSYLYMLKKRKIEIPENAVRIPNGVCISQMISLSDLSSAPISLFAPMMDHARKLKKPFLSDTTAYLCRIHHKNGRRIYDFRVRACISVNEIVDPEALSVL